LTSCLEVLRPVLSQDPDRWPALVWEHRRALVPEVFAAAVVAASGAVTPPPFLAAVHGEPLPHHVRVARVATVQAISWWALYTFWKRLPDGPGSFEQDLRHYVDAAPVLAGAQEHLAHVVSESNHEPLSVDDYCAEAVLATLRSRAGGRLDGHPVWPLSWMRIEYSCQLGDENAERLARVRIDHERARRSIGPGDLRRAAEQFVDRFLDLAADGTVDAKVATRAVYSTFAALGRPEIALQVMHGARLETSAETLVDSIVSMPVPDDEAALVILGFAMPLVEQRRAAELFAVSDAVIAARRSDPASRALVDGWLCTRLREAGLPASVLERLGREQAVWERALPDHAAADRMLDRAFAARDLGDVELAVRMMDAAEPFVQLDDGVRIRHTLFSATMLAEAGSADEALRMLAAVHRQAPELPKDLLACAGDALSRLGLHSDAAICYRQAWDRAVGSGDWQAPVYAALAFAAEAATGRATDERLSKFLSTIDPAVHPEAVLAELAGRVMLQDAGSRTTELIGSLPGLIRQAAENCHLLRYRRAVRLAARTGSGPDSVRWWSLLVDSAVEHGGSPGADSLLNLAAAAYRAGNFADGRAYLVAAFEAMTLDFGSATDYAMNIEAAHGLREPVESLCAAVAERREDVSAEDLRLACEAQRDAVGRSMSYARAEKHNVFPDRISDNMVAHLLDGSGPVAVLEFLVAGQRVLPLLTVNGTSTTSLRLPEWHAADIERLAGRIHYRLDSWTPQRPGDPLEHAGWRAVRDTLVYALKAAISDEHHVIVMPAPTLARMPWHVALMDHWSCSYIPGWGALQTLMQQQSVERDPTEGIAIVPRAGDPAPVLEAMRTFVTAAGAESPPPMLLDSTACDRVALGTMLRSVTSAYLLCHGYLDSTTAEVALMLAADGYLPLAHSVAANHPAAHRHRLGWRDLVDLSQVPRVIISAACSTGISHPVGIGGRAGFYSAMRLAGLGSFVAPAWNVVAADVLPVLARLRHLRRDGAGLAHGVRQAAHAAIKEGVPRWSAYSLTVEGDWR
jgi:hypothetical protein